MGFRANGIRVRVLRVATTRGGSRRTARTPGNDLVAIGRGVSAFRVPPSEQVSSGAPLRLGLGRLGGARPRSSVPGLSAVGADAGGAASSHVLDDALQYRSHDAPIHGADAANAVERYRQTFAAATPSAQATMLGQLRERIGMLYLTSDFVKAAPNVDQMIQDLAQAVQPAHVALVEALIPSITDGEQQGVRIVVRASLIAKMPKIEDRLEQVRLMLVQLSAQEEVSLNESLELGHVLGDRTLFPLTGEHLVSLVSILESHLISHATKRMMDDVASALPDIAKRLSTKERVRLVRRLRAASSERMADPPSEAHGKHYGRKYGLLIVQILGLP